MSRKIALLLVLLLLASSLPACNAPAARDDPAALASLMPADTALFFAARLHPQGQEAETWARARDALLSVPSVKKAVDKMVAQMKEKYPIDWKTYVDPWLGDNMAIGVTDVSALFQSMSQAREGMTFPLTPTLEPGVVPTVPAVTPDQAPFLLAVEVKDLQALDAFRQYIGGLVSADGGVTETPHGDTIIYSVTLEDVPLFFALRDDSTLLVSGVQAVLEAGLDRKEKDSLANSPNFRAVRGRLPEGAMATGYVDSALMQSQMVEAASAENPLVATNPAQAMGIALRAEKDGLRFDFASSLDMKALAESGLQDLYTGMREELRGKATDMLPKGAALALSGQKLGTIFEAGLAQMQKTQPDSYELFQGRLADLKAETGLDLQADFFSLLNGEFAMFISPGQPSSGTSSVPSLHLGLIFQVSDVEKARQTMQKVEDLLAEQSQSSGGGMPLTFNDQEIEGQPVRVISALAMLGYLPGYAFVDDMLVIAVDAPSFTSIFKAEKDRGERLTSSDAFKQVNDALPERRSSLFFLDVPTFVQLVGNLQPEEQRSEIQTQLGAFAETFGGIGSASAAGGKNEDTTTGSAFVRVSK